MDTKQNLQNMLTANGTDSIGSVPSQPREIEMWIKVIGQNRVNFTAVYDPESRCSIMPRCFLEHIKCSDRMKSMPATHDANSRPHECIGSLRYRIRFVGTPGELYWVTFCIVEDVEQVMSAIYIGSETEPPLFPAELPASESREEDGEPIRPILTGREGKEDPKAKADKLLKRKKDDDDHKKKEDEQNRKKRKEGKKEGESQPGKDAERRQTK